MTTRDTRPGIGGHGPRTHAQAGRGARPRLLDLFCGAGGAARGYADAGFDVVGVDIKPQPRYPYEFHQTDALSILRGMLDYPTFNGEMWRPGYFDAIHASPPCHDHTSLTSVAGTDGTGWLLEATRELLIATGLPWIIENVPGAPMRADIVLCGAMFGLRTYRHRWFELSNPMFPLLPEHPPHRVRTSTKKRRACWDAGMNISVTGDVGTYVGRLAMGIDWMTGNELSQAIPPAYTRFIGEQLLNHVTAATS
jgi:DNA (cytosine-5)-methyltransferase 1